MKFGKRRWEAKHEPAAGTEAPPEPAPPAPIAESWSVAAAADPEPVVDGEAVELPLTEVPAEPPVAQAEPVPEPARAPPEPQPIFGQPAPASVAATPHPPGEPHPPPAASWTPAPPPMPFPVAEEPVLVYTSGPDSPAVTPLAEAGEAHASGHAVGTSPSWPEPVLQIAAERPEVLVGAAFAGGLLFAMILRRLGH
jgi:hypothetical protein